MAKMDHSKKTIGVAPMLDVTNREFRQLIRILSKRAILWTEMVVDDTILHCDNIEGHLGFERHNSHPIVCQLGGSDPEKIRKAVSKILEYGYDEININMGCPSSLVCEKSQFGAVLMKKIETAKEAVASLNAATQNSETRISVKCRIGVDDYDSFEHMEQFIQELKPYCKIFYLHARICVLKFTTRENRAIPPLNYPRVYQLCNRFPDCQFYINGGITDLKMAKELCYGTNSGCGEVHHVVPCENCNFHPNGSCVAALVKPPSNLVGCLVGRAMRDKPILFWDIDRYFYGEPSNPCKNRQEVLQQYLEYIETVVPRRCCDSDPREIRTIPAPFQVSHDYGCCPNCVDYVSEDRRHHIAPIDYRSSNSAKVSPYVHSRCLRPLIGVLNGVPRARIFRKEFDRLMKDNETQYKNCGPASLIRRCLRVIDPQHLSKDFEITE